MFAAGPGPAWPGGPWGPGLVLLSNSGLLGDTFCQGHLLPTPHSFGSGTPKATRL